MDKQQSVYASPANQSPFQERDFTARYDPNLTGVLLGNTSIEILREPPGRGRYLHVFFDFDGTLSLIRAGWTEVMLEMMVEILLQTPDCEPKEDVRQVVQSYIDRLTGKQTIYQMMRLVDEVLKRGGKPLSPVEYKKIYLERLLAKIEDRRNGLKDGSIPNTKMLVPGSLNLLEGLYEKGLNLYLFSGTDEDYVREEADLLGLTKYFGKHIYGARDDYINSSKAAVIHRILSENNVEGYRLLGFGDGYVEIDNIKAIGGATVGVASDEHSRNGKPDPCKRSRLVAVGADLIVPDYREAAALLDYLMPECPIQKAAEMGIAVSEDA